MNYIITNVLEKELFYNNELVLKYHIEYPSIKEGLNKFNCYNKELAFIIKHRAENELYNEAVETYKYNKENGYPTMVYEIYRNFEVTLNNCNIISLYLDEYTYTGGAHGTTLRTSQNWNLMQGFMFPLESLFFNDLYFVIGILKEINDQIAQNPEIYFENSCNLVLETFNPASFYLTSDSIIIYFQQYDIAPYSSGIRTFNIKY